MPTIHIIGAIRILMYFDDHAEYGEYEALISINLIEIMRGELPTRQRKVVLKWAKAHQAFLKEKWKEFNPNN